MQLLNTATSTERRSLQSRASRLRRESKDALIAKLILMERAVNKQKAAENLLRDEILRLTHR